MSKLPSDIHGQVLPRLILRAYPTLGPVFYVDTWPFGPPILALTSADGANQITIAHSLPKFTMLRDDMKAMTGGMDLVTLEGQQWKTWRTVFNPGFSLNHLMTMVPHILEDVLVFCEILEQRAASGEIFSMDPLTTNLSLGIIGRLAMDVAFNSQRQQTSFTTALRSQKQPDDFLPQRWLVGKDDPLFNAEKGAWRSFEYGPRNCIGQELAMLELKLVLALTLRKFNVESAYDEYDKIQARKGPKTVDGDRAYQIVSGAAHPSDSFPCKVSMRT
ncbi:MAG: hypothetical protein Q9181_006054 [Wetmoreana brouardii]